MNQQNSDDFETRYEWMRPGQLIARRDECPLAFFPVAPLEYHGPHMPLGTDPINASQVAHACCRKMGKGIVRPALTMGTERERPPEILESLGLEHNTYVVGMDFPSRIWNSHYATEDIFSIALREELQLMIKQGYRYVYIVNGHGALNQRETLDRICIELNNTTDAKLAWSLPIAEEALKNNWAGHAEIIECSLMMYYRPDCVDVDTLPPRDVPIKSYEYSSCDGVAFTPDYKRDHIVEHDPRDSTIEKGQKWFDECVEETVAKVEELMNN